MLSYSEHSALGLSLHFLLRKAEGGRKGKGAEPGPRLLYVCDTFTGIESKQTAREERYRSNVLFVIRCDKSRGTNLALPVTLLLEIPSSPHPLSNLTRATFTQQQFVDSTSRQQKTTTMADVEEPQVDEAVEEPEVEEEEEEEFVAVGSQLEVKLFGKWSFDDIEIRDISLVVSFLLRVRKDQDDPL